MLKCIIGMFKDGILSSILAILMILCVSAIVMIIGYGIYWCIDSFFRPTLEGNGTIVRKDFTPSHTQTIMVYNASLKTSLPQVIYHDDDWSICVKLCGRVGDISISEDLYGKLKINEGVFTEYSEGRLNKKNIYIKSIIKF